MKTLCRDGISYYMFADSKIIAINSVNVAVGEPVEYYIGDMNSSNCLLYENITEPNEYVGGGKYMFDGTTWSDNPAWVAMPEEEAE